MTRSLSPQFNMRIPPMPPATLPDASSPATPVPGLATIPMPVDLLQSLLARLGRMETDLAEVRRAVVEKPAAKAWYSVDEVAALLGKSKLTVREYCRDGRVHAKKRKSGRGTSLEWCIAHEEVERIGNEGLLPLRKYVPDRL